MTPGHEPASRQRRVGRPVHRRGSFRGGPGPARSGSLSAGRERGCGAGRRRARRRRARYRSSGAADCRCPRRSRGCGAEGTLRIGSLQGSGMHFDGVELHLAGHDGKVSISLAGRTLGGTVALDGGGKVARRRAAGRGSAGAGRGFAPPAARGVGITAGHRRQPGARAAVGHGARWALTPRSAALSKLDLQLDDSRSAAIWRIDDFDTLASRFDLTADHLDLDRYLPAPAAADSTSAVAAPAEIPVQTSGTLSTSGRLRARRTDHWGRHPAGRAGRSEGGPRGAASRPGERRPLRRPATRAAWRWTPPTPPRG